MAEGASAVETSWWQRIVWGRNPRRTLLRALALAVVCLVVFRYILIPIQVRGPSMLPTYQDGRINFVNKLSYLRHEPRRGDVVAIRTSGEHVMFMKRIVGMPGETIEFHDGHILINGKVLYEPYMEGRPFYWEQDAKTLGPDEFYFVGDNRSMPIGDHTQGIAERSRIVGRVLL